jgi:hypothetical protein
LSYKKGEYEIEKMGEENTKTNKINFITEEIRRSGFPFEFEIASILEDDGWEVLPSSPYWDRDEGKWREIDIKAYKSFEHTSNNNISVSPYRLTIAMIIECKKSDKFAWVFFCGARDKKEKQLRKVEYLDFLTIVKRQCLLKADFLKGNLVQIRKECRMLNIDSDIISEDAVVTPEIAKKLKFFSDFGIITTNTFRSFAAKKNKSLKL